MVFLDWFCRIFIVFLKLNYDDNYENDYNFCEWNFFVCIENYKNCGNCMELVMFMVIFW